MKKVITKKKKTTKGNNSTITVKLFPDATKKNKNQKNTLQRSEKFQRRKKSKTNEKLYNNTDANVDKVHCCRQFNRTNKKNYKHT